MQKTSRVETFLTAVAEKEIVETILEAEKETSGEIRVHIERSSKTDPYERAREVFHMLKMDNTKEDNGVLIYVAVEDKKFVIYGDKGINAVVPADFWNKTKDLMEVAFKRGEFKEGIIKGIQSAGKELRGHFPYRRGDHNELTNEVSKE